MSPRARLLFVLLLVVSGAAVGATSARAASPGRLAVTALSFSPATVDATSGSASATLTWTVTDSNPSAADVAGDVYIRMAGPVSGEYVGMASVAPFDLTGALSGDRLGDGSGTAQKATFSYTFSVPQYANATGARWVISGATAGDDQSGSADIGGVSLARFHAVLDATELVDSAAPTYDEFLFNIPDQRPYLYDNGTTASVTYSLEVVDPESGFWKGTVELSGPDGQHARGVFATQYSVTEALDTCGQGIGFGSQDIICSVTVTIPANAAAGTWEVSAITLTDNAGNTKTYSGLSDLPVTVTANKVITASGFSANPSTVNDWGTFPRTELTMAVTGASGGVSAIYVDGTVGACGQVSTTPVQNSDGTYSVTLYVADLAPSCTITGIAVVDGAGDVSLYGSEYGAPDPGVTITRIPDTPPTVTGASVSPASLPAAASDQNVTLTTDIGDVVAPVNEVLAVICDSSGSQVGLASDTYVSNASDIAVSVPVTVPAGIAPGTYSLGFDVIDLAGMHTAYGCAPGGVPVPGGPLTLTITSS